MAGVLTLLQAGSLEHLLEKHQKTTNNTARAVIRSSKQEYVSPLLRALSWFPICQRINNKLSVICSLSVTGSDPQHLVDILRIYVPSRHVRCPSEVSVSDPFCHNKVFDRRSFACQGLTVCNQLAHNTRHAAPMNCFKTCFVLFLFLFLTEPFRQQDM